MSLQLFPRPVGDIGLGAFSAEAPTVTLQDLTQLDVRVTWDEAVSIVEELCVAAQGLVMRPIPAARDIILNENGTVAIRQAAAGVPDPVEAARRLHDLLGGAVAPAPLRLFVSQAVSSGTYNSLGEFEDALAYYAKPGGRDRVKAVYQRASEQVKLRPQAAIDPAHPKAVATPPPPPYATSSRFTQSQRRLALMGLATAGVASMVFGLALYFWPAGSSTSTGTPAADAEVAAAPADPAAAVPPPAAGAPAAPVSARAPAGQPSARTSSALDAAQIPLTGFRAAIGYRPGMTGARQGVRSSTAAPGAPAPASMAAASPANTRFDAARVPAQPQLADGDTPAAIMAAAPEPSPATIYSSSDAAVQPALLSKPQLLPPVFADGAGKPIRMEFIVSPTGTVERARFLEAPQRMADMMLLSSAKTWLFTPALKDGQPVRYRTVLSWVGAP